MSVLHSAVTVQLPTGASQVFRNLRTEALRGEEFGAK